MLFSIEVKVCATVYIEASSPEEAMKKLKSKTNAAGGLAIDALTAPGFGFLSPGMTCYGPWEGVKAELVRE